jgi:carbon starvation protein CstA
MAPRAELVHWLFATGFLLFGMILLAEAIVGEPVWRRRRWRVYLWPGLAFACGVMLWPVAVFFTSSTLHMLAHTAWAELALLAGAVQLALVQGKLSGRWGELTLILALLVSGTAFLVHEQNPWLFSRAAFLHHTLGWTLIVAAVFPLGALLRPRLPIWRFGFALTWVMVAVLLYCDRDVAPIFGHLSDVAGSR